MRILAVIALLAATALAGCLDNNDLDTYSAPDVDPEQKVLPERKFEPVVTLDINYFEFEPGDNVVVTWDVSDLHDYPFPLTFIDWTLKYSGAPNFVAEGDANQLPGSYERIIYAEGFYRFTLDISDNQDLDESHDIIIKVGDPVIEEVVEEGAPLEVIDHVWKAYVADGCYLCVETQDAGVVLGALGCVGYGVAGENNVDCAWVSLNERTWGQPFKVTSYLNTYDETGASDVFGTEGSPDVEFMESCSSGTSVSQEYINTGSIPEGTIPEGAGCMVAFDYFWPNAGHTFTFEWKETPGPYPGLTKTKYVEPDSCSVPLVLGCEPQFCIGFSMHWDGHGCTWVEVPPTAEGQPFTIKSFPVSAAGKLTLVGETGELGDPDGFALTTCDLETAEVITSYGAGGGEADVIPPGTGCLLAYEWTAIPTRIDINIEAAV